MATDLIIPPLGESITEAVISKWLKQPGEAVTMDEPMVDLETDKVSVTLPAPAAGVLGEQRAAAGSTVKVGEVIGIIVPGPPSTAANHPAAAATATPLATRPRASMPEPAPVAVAAPEPAPETEAEPMIVAESQIESSSGPPRKLSPSQRRAVREHDGEALHAAARPALAEPVPSPPSAPAQLAPRPVAVPSIVGPALAAPADALEEVVAMTPLRKRIAERLVAAQHTAAILTTFNEVDMSAVGALREKWKDAFLAKHGVKLGFMSFFVRACVEGLKEYPGLNAEVRGNDIVYKKHYDVGVAVGGGRGLVVPVVRGADRMSFADIERAVAELGARAKAGKLTLDELAGGTFSITNGGIYGSLLSTPLLNLPQTGILGMHNIVKRPVAVGDEIALRPMMYIALSYDHRVADGREAVQFLVAVKQRLEAPERLLFNV